MFNTLREEISQLSDAELEAKSLQETLSLEEMVCDTASSVFIEKTAEMPENPSDAANLHDSEIDAYQVNNQDRLVGIDDEDLLDMNDPDQKPISKECIMDESADAAPKSIFDECIINEGSLEAEIEAAEEELGGGADDYNANVSPSDEGEIDLDEEDDSDI